LKYLLLFALFVALPIAAQVSLADTSANGGLKYAIALYTKAMKEESHLYNGREDVNYNFRLNGHPYFEGREWKIGNLEYDGSLYENVPLMYNLLSQQLLTRHHDGYIRIQLSKEKVHSFTLAGHSFLNIQAVSKKKAGIEPGYYDVLADGETKFVVFRTKKIDELISSDNQVRRDVLVDDERYIFKQGNYIKITSKGSVYKALKEKKKELQKYVIDNNLDFKSNPEYAIAKIIEHYNGLINE